MKALIFSKEDTASMNVLNKFKENYDLIKEGECCNNTFYKLERFHLFILNEKMVHSENIDEIIKNVSKTEYEDFIFVSKHRSEAGIKCLTVHPFGNYGEADLGGKRREIVSVNPVLLTGSLLKLNELNTIKDFSINFEVTHHGPFISGRGFFIEIGSSENEYKNDEAGKILMNAIMDMNETGDDIIAVGIGGGHYAPRFTSLALSRKISFGHMAPKYHAKDIDEEMLKKMINRSNAKYIIMEKKDLNSAERKRLNDIISTLHGLELLDPDSLEPRY